MNNPEHISRIKRAELLSSIGTGVLGAGIAPFAGEVPCTVCNPDPPARSRFPCRGDVPQTWTGRTGTERSRGVG